MILIKTANWQTIRNRLFLSFLLATQIIHVCAQLTRNNFYLNNEIRLERLAIENGLSNNIAFGITQDKKGFMWFATLEALIKYDGYTLTRYQNNPQDTNSLGDNVVMSAFEDHSGLIWVGTAGGGGVNSFDPQTEKWKRYPHNPKNPNSMGKGSIEGIAEDLDGMLWFGSTDGLTRYNPKTNKFTLFENNPKKTYSLSNNHVYSIVVDNAGMLWIGTDKGVNLFDPEQERFSQFGGGFEDSSVLKATTVHHIYKDIEGLLWLSSFGSGVFVIDPVSKKGIAHYKHDLKNSFSIGSDIVYAITRDLTGGYWVSTVAGLYHFNSTTKFFTLYENESFLPKTVTSGHIILTDRAGLVWIGTVGRGIIYFSPQQRNFSRYLNDQASLSFGQGTNRIKSIFKSGDNSLYVTTSKNLLKFNESTDNFEEVLQLKSIKGILDNCFFITACEERPGIFWLGTDRSGIVSYDIHTHKTTFFQNDSSDTESLANNDVQVLYKDRSGRVWIGTQGGHLQWYDADRKKFIRYPYLAENEDVPPGAGIRFIYEDRQGDLWLGIKAFHMALGGNGLYQIRRQTGKIKHYTYQPGVSGSLSSNSVTCFYEDRKGIFWVGTYGGGLNRLDATSGKIVAYTKETGLISNSVQGIAGDDLGNIWLNADEGITRFNSTTLSTKHFGQSDGLATSALGVEADDYNAFVSMESKEGAVYFGSNNGMTMFHPGNIAENNFKPNVVLTQFKVFDKAYPMGGKEISLAYNQNFLDFEFAALSYLSSEKNQYTYKLDGVDNDWVKNGTQRIAHYTNISPGKYTFHVKGSNNDGMWNEQDTKLTITIKPPWWLTWWAYTIYGLFLIGSIWGFIYSRSIKLLSQKRLLENEVAIRTAEVVHQKEELQTTLEDLKSTQAQLIQSEKMASLGELTAGIAHEIQNPLNFVNNFSELNGELIKELVEEASSEKRNARNETELLLSIKENSEKINHHGKRAESIVKGMLEHSRKSTGVKEPTDINKLCDEFVRLSYHGLRAKDPNLPTGQAGFNCDYKLDLDPDIPLVNVVSQEIGRVILNIVNNAFQATDNRVGLSVIPPKDQHGLSESKKDYKPLVTLTTHFVASLRRCEICITDNGPGIPDHIKDKIFQPFFTTKPTGQGTGLGLSLAYDIIKAHGGEIKVKTKPARIGSDGDDPRLNDKVGQAIGWGTEFIIQIPI